MADYVEIDAARSLPGLRLALTAGVPGPFGEAARYFFEIKKVPYVRVRQVPMVSDVAMRQWTAQTSAPVAVYEDERPRSSWVEILYLAERLAPTPRLIPEHAEDRVRMFGLCHEICGDLGFLWQRRLMLIHTAEQAGGDAGGVLSHLGRKYGYSRATGEAATARSAAILRTLSAQLRAQRDRGSRFFVGDAVSAVDLQWAASSAMLDPLPPEVCPMPDALRAGYTAPPGEVRDAADPVLLEHRDFIYRELIGLPLDL